jgi:type II secretory pathway pseudopilin PulG
VKTQRGFALLEAIAVIAVVSLCGGALLLAVSAAARLERGPGRNRAAASILAAQTLRVAEDAWKYGTLQDAPGGSAVTSMHVQGSSEVVPVTISSAISSQTADGAAITITVSYPAAQTGDDSGIVTLTGALRVKAPLPGAQVERPGLIPRPPGAL